MFDMRLIYGFLQDSGEFTYIVRAVMTLEGIGTQVDPTSLFEMRSYAKRYVHARGRYLRS